MMCSDQKREGMAAFVAVMLCFTGQPASANSVCVTCDGPPGVYSCSYAPVGNGAAPSKSKRVLQFACIQDVARQYKHASCSVNRNQLGACNGVVHMISQTPTAPSGQVNTNAQVQPKAPVVRTQREPKTVVEMAKRTASDTKKQIDKSARSVSNAARSTWRCVTTLFQKC